MTKLYEVWERGCEVGLETLHKYAEALG
jgi:hypothetical protein